MAIDYNGIALVLGAIGVLLASVGSFVVSMVTLHRQGKLADNVQKIELATNSMKDALVEATRGKALLEGAATQRAATADARSELASAPAPAPTQVEIVSVDRQALPLPVEVVKPSGKEPKKT